MKLEFSNRLFKNFNWLNGALLEICRIFSFKLEVLWNEFTESFKVLAALTCSVILRSLGEVFSQKVEDEDQR